MWQGELLQKYGNTITLMDATYKTTRYDLALFFICVRTNVGYQVVGEFITQSETSEQIAEALTILKSWNPSWNPPYFMVDYSDAELGAIEQVFPHCKVFLCDFHREQAWERWVKVTSYHVSLRNYVLYSRKLSRIGEKYNFCGENFRGLLASAAPKDATPPNFAEKIFANHHKTVKFAKVFSLESFPLYGI